MKKLLAASAFALVAGLPVAQPVLAQAPVHADALISHQTAARRHAAGLALEHRGDDKGAFVAFLDAAENGYPPAQRKLGEIYDSGNPAVKRNFSASMHWYEKAREAGEDIPFPKSPMPSIFSSP